MQAIRLREVYQTEIEKEKYFDRFSRLNFSWHAFKIPEVWTWVSNHANQAELTKNYSFNDSIEYVHKIVPHDTLQIQMDGTTSSQPYDCEDRLLDVLGILHSAQ